MNVRRMWFPSAVVVGAVAAVLACSAQQSGRGQLAVELVDAPNPAVDEIWVTVTQVRVHEAGSGWTTITPAQPLAVDLLKLQTYAAPLGLVDLPAGTVTQLRLLVEKDTSYVVTGGAQVALKVPSGAESGIKIHGPWKVSACTQTTVTLDFDGRRSIWYHQTTGGEEWILRPVIHTKKTAHAPVSCGEEGGGEEGSDAGGDGAACEGPTDCLSGVCSVSGTCEPGGPDVPCGDAADCASGTCNEDGTCDARDCRRGRWELLRELGLPVERMRRSHGRVRARPPGHAVRRGRRLRRGLRLPGRRVRRRRRREAAVVPASPSPGRARRIEWRGAPGCEAGGAFASAPGKLPQDLGGR